MEGFEGLTSGFDLSFEDLNEITEDIEKMLPTKDFDKAVEEVKNDMQLIEIKKKDIVNRVNTQPVFQDQEFIQTELRSLILSARTVMYKVEQDIKIGADARKIEVYAKLVEAIGKQYQSLIELNKNIFEAKVQNGDIDINNIGNNKISLSSEQLLDMINKASEGSQMNQIEANFEITDESLPSSKFKKKNKEEE